MTKLLTIRFHKLEASEKIISISLSDFTKLDCLVLEIEGIEPCESLYLILH